MLKNAQIMDGWTTLKQSNQTKGRFINNISLLDPSEIIHRNQNHSRWWSSHKIIAEKMSHRTIKLLIRFTTLV